MTAMRTRLAKILMTCAAGVASGSAGFALWHGASDIIMNVPDQGTEAWAVFKSDLTRARGEALHVLPLSKLAASFRARTLWTLSETLPMTHSDTYQNVHALFRYAHTCDGSFQPPDGLEADLRKALAWQRFACGHAELPQGFFETAPFMHPSGVSYAYLGRRRGLETPSDALHLAELGAAGVDKTFAADVQALTRWSPDALNALADTKAAFFENDHLYVLDTSAQEYFAVPGAVARARAARGNLRLDALKSSLGCPHAWGDVCLVPAIPDRRDAMQKVVVIAAGACATSLVLILACGAVLALQARRVRQERNFVMQLLAHEIRTPVTALALIAEELRPEFDNLSEDGQGALMGFLAEMQRLGRVVEASGTYLRAQGALEFMAPAGEGVASIHALLEQVRDECAAPDSVKLTLNGEDAALPHPEFWVGVCVKNLIRNALAHGKPPVEVTCEIGGPRIIIRVCDQGEGTHLSLSKVSRTFARGKGSAGLGLGLSIVARAVAGMKGTLALKRDPTCFEISLRRMARGEHSLG